MSPSGTKLIASNRKARRDYAILDTVECGLVLVGSEVKSLRAGHVQLADAFARVKDGECWMEGVRIAPYAFAKGFGSHEPDRPRKLLLHRSQLDKLAARVAQESLTLVPLSLYFRDGRAKVELALAKGRRKGDHRHALAERDAAREAARALGRQRKGME
jgi:SsrA-binding protein